jgi:hypothetical protein
LGYCAPSWRESLAYSALGLAKFPRYCTLRRPCGKWQLSNNSSLDNPYNLTQNCFIRVMNATLYGL